MQAIRTKFISPSNVRGSRIKATCQTGSVTLHWDHALNPDDNHAKAAEALARKYGWHGCWIGGGLPDGTSCFVCYDLRMANGHFIIPQAEAA